MMTTYTHLQPEERITLASLKQQGYSLRSIAAFLGRSASTLSRELCRNAGPQGYTSRQAQAQYQQRQQQAKPLRKLHADGLLWNLVSHMLMWCWSPRQISLTLKRMYPVDKTQQVSHETIYNAIYAYPRGELKKQLISLLRCARNVRRPRSGGKDRRGHIPEMVSIHVRPPEVNDRLMPGHWEGDLIKGAGNKSAVGVLVERSSRMVLLCKMADSSAESALAAFTYKLNQIAAPLRLSLTYDQGKEMSCHQELARQTNMRVYFCDPHSPWQKGSCENINGLLRQFLPKGSDLSAYDQVALDSIADLLNNRPRETLNCHSPYQVFKTFMQSISESKTATIN
jgi:transposase, IS30 family